MCEDYVTEELRAFADAVTAVQFGKARYSVPITKAKPEAVEAGSIQPQRRPCKVAKIVEVSGLKIHKRAKPP